VSHTWNAILVGLILLVVPAAIVIAYSRADRRAELAWHDHFENHDGVTAPGCERRRRRDARTES
jgi:hypothetical protein